jgi:GNAT superfamily N-acetyltransferase
MGLNGISLRALVPADWQDFRAIRLDALRTARGNFSASLEKASSEPDAYWRKMLDGEGKRIFGLHDGDRLIGITGVFAEDGPEGRYAGLHMSFILPGYRGRGLSRLFYAARLAWAREAGLREAYVSHRDGNAASQAAILAHGFTPFRVDERDWPDGMTAKDFVYRLEL